MMWCAVCSSYLYRDWQCDGLYDSGLDFAECSSGNASGVTISRRTPDSGAEYETRVDFQVFKLQALN